MNHSFTFNDTTLKRIPKSLVIIIILLLSLPYIALHFGIDFSIAPNKLAPGPNTHLIELEVRGYLRQILFQWAGFSFAAMTVLLAFIQYRLTNDKIALIIGLSLLFSGSLEGLHILLVDGISLEFGSKNNLDALIWIFSNSIAGLILMGGLTLLLVHGRKEASLNIFLFCMVIFFLVLISMAIIYYVITIIELPSMWFKDSYFSRPYEAISIAIYAFILIFIYPRCYKSFPSILTNCIFYIALTQIVISLYLMMLSQSPYDSAYNIAYFLKIIAYLIPFSCLVINYFTSYSSVLNTQIRLKIKQRELEYIASHDSLTNLYNRREFEELLHKSIANASRDKQRMALLLIDLDNFKTTNDTFGHNHGDELLKQFSNRLILMTRSGDLLSRVGGDEFTLIGINLDIPSSARHLAERILNELNNPYPINGKLITVTVSIGIAMFPADGTTAEDLLKNADLAMYKAKNSGKNTYKFYTEELSFAQHRESEVETHLRKALLHDEFELLYQPKYNLVTRKIIGAEILLHWNNPTLGAIQPEEFIPIAERTGLIIDIGHWIVQHAFKQIMKWNHTHHQMLSFSINISPTQLAHNQFLSILERNIHHYNYPTDFLELEITENLLMSNEEEVNSILHKISSLGIKLSLDDFGKGYSSLNRLKTLPIDILKIDKDFIDDIHNETDSVVIIDIIIKLAKELDMEIVAEGVETIQQVNYLIQRKCHIVQGFLFSKPVNADTFVRLAY